MDEYERKWARYLVALLSLVIQISSACNVPSPKPLSAEECDCHHYGSDAHMTCYSDVDCYNTEDNTDIYIAYWTGYKYNGSFTDFSFDDPKYQVDTHNRTRGNMTEFSSTLIIHNVTDVDYNREFQFAVITQYDGMQQLPPIRLCNKTERTLVEVVEPVNRTVLVVVLVISGACFIGLICAVYINLPFVKYFFLRCCGKEILHKRKATDGLDYDTALLYDTTDAHASLIADTLKNDLASRGLDVASAGDVLGDQPQMRELHAIPTSAIVMYIITGESTVDQLLKVARDEASMCKTSKEQILVHTDQVPSEFIQYRLLTLRWFEGNKQKSSRPAVQYRVCSTTDTNREIVSGRNGICNGSVERSPNPPDDSVDNVNFSPNPPDDSVDNVNFSPNPPDDSVDNVNFSPNPPDDSVDNVNFSPNPPDDSVDNVNFIVRLYRKWRRRKFYKALELGLSTGFRAKKVAGTSLATRSAENSSTENE